jgi:BirA family transcriptional regulator, biotin operon repressor / biotin---[acetyl-CoA-carboxylase] ligase
MYNVFMKIIVLNQVDSTHHYLKEHIKTYGFCEPLCIATTLQTNGIGSRGNVWIGQRGNLFFSFVLKKNSLPFDLPLQSASIYFSYILKMILEEKESKVWLKWPNDFYIEDKKIGGTITSVNQELIYCGIGLNLEKMDKEYGHLDIKISMDEILNDYFLKLEKLILWKHIFSEFKIEFQKSRFLKSTVNGEKVSLKNAVLNDDGSISLGDKKVFSLR